MTDDKRLGSGLQEPQPVKFATRLAGSDTFKNLFRDGMSLVEETAAYLDGQGREESKDLSRTTSLTYATESMRLTTRLMQLASWLLLQRAVNEGEMSAEQAGLEKAKVKLDSLSSAQSGADWEELPAQLRELVEQSVRLQKRIRHLDGTIYGTEEVSDEQAPNPVATQLDHLARALNVDGPSDDK